MFKHNYHPRYYCVDCNAKYRRRFTFSRVLKPEKQRRTVASKAETDPAIWERFGEGEGKGSPINEYGINIRVKFSASSGGTGQMSIITWLSKSNKILLPV